MTKQISMRKMVSQNDLENFQKCPVIHTKYREILDNKPQTESVIKQCLTKTFTKELELKGSPDYRPMVTIWGKYLEKIRKTGTSIKECNNITFALKGFYDSYKREIYNKDLRVIAVNFPITYVTSDMVYSDNIPALLISKTNKIIPVFYIDGKGPQKQNLVRFLSAAAQNTLKTDIEDYIYIRITQQPYSFKLSRHSFRINELDRAESELNMALDLISSEYNVPNTTYCTSCKFNSICRL